MPDQPPEPFIFTAIAQRFLPVLAVVIFVPLLYLELTTAYVNTQDAIKAHAVAYNAAVKQGGEAVSLSEQAKTAVETARNAAQRNKAEAEQAQAEAVKFEAEGRILKEKAEVADRKARADALTVVNEAKLRQAKIIAAIADLRNVARKEKAEVEQIENDAITQWSIAGNFLSNQ